MLEIYFETYGCTANLNSTEIMKGLVKQAGLNLTSSPEFSDLVVINSCIVKEATQEKIRRRVSDLLKQKKKIILAGCMPRIFQKELQHENLFLLDTSQTKRITELIKEISEQTYDEDSFIKPRNEVKSALPKISQNKFVGINQISEGCSGECSYCVVRLVKGKLFSYPKETILKSIKTDLESGSKEIWITSQDNAAYGNDDGKNSLPELLKEILKLKGNFFVRVGMMNPDNVLKILPELIEIYKHPKMFKFLHLPIQSGSDKILKEMKRKYKTSDVKKIISEFKKAIPEITISTDIIVGYPGETEKDFGETSNLLQEIKPEILNRSNFCSRPGTPASKLKQISSATMKQRATKLMNIHLEICREIQNPWLGKTEAVLVDSRGFGNTYLARNPSYKLFAVFSQKNILGKKLNVQVKKTLPHYLVAGVEE